MGTSNVWKGRRKRRDRWYNDPLVVTIVAGWLVTGIIVGVVLLSAAGRAAGRTPAKPPTARPEIRATGVVFVEPPEIIHILKFRV